MKNMLLTLWFCIASLLCTEALNINQNVVFRPKTTQEILHAPNQLLLQESDMERMLSSENVALKQKTALDQLLQESDMERLFSSGIDHSIKLIFYLILYSYCR
jgi:hypothetical protein